VKPLLSRSDRSAPPSPMSAAAASMLPFSQARCRGVRPSCSSNRGVGVGNLKAEEHGNREIARRVFVLVTSRKQILVQDTAVSLSVSQAASPQARLIPRDNLSAQTVKSATERIGLLGQTGCNIRPLPTLARASTSAPPSSSACTTGWLPFRAARCSARNPVFCRQARKDKHERHCKQCAGVVLCMPAECI
jgi:hypothetical protein